MIFYPIFPLLALIALLWVEPRGELDDSKLSQISKVLSIKMERSISKEIKYHKMQFFVTIARAIAGGVESPLQLTFQVSNIL